MEYAAEFFARVNGLTVEEPKQMSSDPVPDPLQAFTQRCELNFLLGLPADEEERAVTKSDGWDTPLQLNKSASSHSDFGERSAARFERVKQAIYKCFGDNHRAEAEEAIASAKQLLQNERAQMIVDLTQGQILLRT